MSKYLAHHLSHISEHRKKRVLFTPGAAFKMAGAAMVSADAAEAKAPVLTKPEEMTWRDYLIMLLHIGSELEHGLMVQYLYAAYSLGNDELSKEDQAEVQEWQDLILTVAREEMGHLLTVQNLLCLLGGPITFERENYPWQGPFYPFAFNFEPLSRESLANYVFAEMPENFERLEKYYAGAGKGSFGEHFRDIDLPFIEKRMNDLIAKGGACPVGEVYSLVHDIIADPKLIHDSEFRAETYPLQASWDDWGRSYRPNPSSPNGDAPKSDSGKANIIIEQVATRTEALYAIKEIAGQGENPDLRPRKGEEPSHFARFVGLLERYDEKLAQRGDWSPARKVPTNPTTTPSDDPKAPPPGNLISCPASAKWADLFNCRYRMLLTYLTHTFRLAREVDPDLPNTRGAVMHRIFGEMYNLKAISGILVRMPLTENPGDDRRAGPPFQMPYSLVLPPDEIDCWRLHRDNIRSSQSLCESLLDPESDLLATTPPEGAPYLKTLRNLDTSALTWVDTVLGGLRDCGGKHS